MNSIGTLSVEVRKSTRAKRMSLVVHWNGKCEVVVPQNRKMTPNQIEKFIHEHAYWARKQVLKRLENGDKVLLSHQGVPKEKVSKKTKKIIQTHIQKLSEQGEFNMRDIVVKKFSSMWGRCTDKNKIAFHYKLSLLPEHLSYYIVAHELCHTIYFNHSKSFWRLVETYCPNYKSHKKELKNYVL